MYKYLLKNYGLIIIAAALVGLIYLTPQVFFQLSLGEKFQGIYQVLNNDEIYYMARARDIIDGHYLLSNPYFLEYKNSQSMQVFLPDLMSALPAKIFHIGIYPLFEFYDFFLPALAFFLTTLIVYFILRDRSWALLLSGWFFLIKYFVLFGRPVSPQLVFIFVLSLTLLMLKIVVEKDGVKKRPLLVLAGINFGLLFYVYTYFWTYYVTVLALLLVYFAWQKQRQSVKNIVFILALGLIIGVPYFYQTIIASRLSVFKESIERVGMLNTHLPSGIQIIIPAFIFILLYVIFLSQSDNVARAKNGAGPFVVIGVLAAIINVNQHVLTGKNLFFSSHYELISYFFLLLAFGWLVWQNQKIVNFLKLRLVKAAFAIILLIVFIPHFVKILNFNQVFWENKQRFGQVFDWLNANTKKDSVVMADEEWSSIVPSYTHNNVFFAPAGGLFFVGNQEILDRFVLNNFWQKDFDKEYIKNNINAVYGYQFSAQGGRVKQKNKLKKILGMPQDDENKYFFPEDKIQKVLEYFKVRTEQDWVEGLKKYQVNYLIFDQLNLDWITKDLSQYQFLRPVSNINGIAVYEVK